MPRLRPRWGMGGGEGARMGGCDQVFRGGVPAAPDRCTTTHGPGPHVDETPYDHNDVGGSSTNQMQSSERTPNEKSAFPNRPFAVASGRVLSNAVPWRPAFR